MHDLIEEVEAQEPSLKLEVGKSYRNIKGEVREIINFLRDTVSFPYYDEEGVSYKEDGSAVYRPSYFNLIEEVKAEEPTPEEVKAKEPPPKEVKAEKPTPEEVKEPTLLVPKGRVLQCRRTKDGEWEDIHTCAGDFEYRVKPSRETVVEYTAVLSTGYSLLPRKILKHQTGSPRNPRIAVIKITTTFDGDVPNLPTVEVISHEDALKLEEQNEVAK
jgi:hypothetical protein